MKLLIVDDHDVDLEVLRARIDADGNTVLQSANDIANEALLAAVQEAVKGSESAAQASPQSNASALEAQALALQGRIARLEQSEAQLLESNRDLRARMRRRTIALEIATRDLESFSYSISHDLRAPLRAIGGFTDIVLRDHVGDMPSDGLHLLERVVANVKRMNQLIDELLEFSRAGLGELAVQSINVGRLVRECLDALLDADAQGRTEITVGDLPPCRADLPLFKQALLNLLSNAVKFSRNREPARIEIGAEVGDAELIYHVRDNGVGFDMRMAHKLFQVYQRLHAQRDFEGAGVGLAIVRRVIERHGGRVWAKSEPDRGATFYFSLPIGGPPEAADR